MLSLPLFVASGAILLLITAAVAVAVARQDRAERAMAGRIELIVTPHSRINGLQRMGRRRATVRSGVATARFRLAKLFGYDASRAGHYVVRGPVVAGMTLLFAVIACHLLSELVGVVARLAIPALWIMTCRKVFVSFEQRHARKLYGQFPDALSMIVRSVRVGIPVSEAVRNVAREALEPTATEFAMLSDQIAIGVALDEALMLLATRNGLPEYRFFATALSLQAQTGGGLSETLENLAEVIRKRVGVRKRAHALASEARTSTYVLAALPIFTGCALGVINPGYIGLLFTNSTGQAVLAAAISMLCVGMMVMRATITRSLR